MGEVYKAKDTRLDRTVAVKVLPQHLSENTDVRQRFEREAKTISQLSHPHICALYDVGNQDGVEYLVMEYLEGETLAERLLKGALPAEETLRYGIEIADALDKAHRRGIVHRDLKPGNVMLTKSGVKLLDFGLAKTFERTLDAAGRGPAAAGQHPAAGNSLTAMATVVGSSPLTQEGTILGTIQYMAPEQLEGKETDARADVFALGAVLYEMATGRKAFSGASQASLIGAILHTEPAPLSAVAPLTPPGLDRVVRRCLAKDPERRFQSARDVALELEESSRVTEISPARSSAPGRRIAGLAGWAVAALLLAILLAVLLAPGRAGRPSAETRLRFTISPPAGAAFEGMLALSPDGRTLAFVAATADGKDLLFFRPLDSLEARVLSGTEGAAYPFWSPDGKSLAFFAEEKLKRIDVSGGTPQTLCDAPGARGGSWGSSGEIVFAAETGAQMKVVSAGGGEPRLLAHLQSRRGESYRWPSFLPDGRHFLYFALSEDAARSGVYWGLLDSKETALLAVADSGALYTPRGYLLYRSGNRLLAHPFDASHLRMTGEAVPLVEDVWWDGISTLATAFTISPGGTLAYQTGGLSLTQLVLYDRNGVTTRTVGPPSAYLEPAFSPDGRRVAVGRTEPGARGSAVWVMDPERGTTTRLSSFSSLASTPVWSPDGRSVAYNEFPSGQVFVREASGGEKEKLLFAPPAFTPLDDWSRDGRYVLHEIVEWPRFRFHVGLWDLQQGSDRPLLKEPYDLLGARFSPDGRWLAYESEESGAREVFVQSFPGPGQRRQISAQGGTQPRWRGDGKELFYVSPDRKIMAVDIRTQPALDSGPPRALFQTRILPTIEARNHYDATADGQRFIVNSRRPEDASLPITVVAGWEPEPKRKG
jgi:Tol biopolymer transport system component